MKKLIHEILSKARFFGLFPLSDSFHIAKPLTCVDAFSCFILAWCLFSYRNTISIIRWDLFYLTIVIHAVLVCILIIATPYVLVIKGNYLKRVTEDLVEANRLLKMVGIRMNYQSQTYSYVIPIAYSFIHGYLLYMFMEFLSIEYILLLVYTFLANFRLYTLGKIIAQFMAAMERLLTLACRAFRNKPMKLQDTVHVLLKCHSLVCTASENMNEAFGFQLLILTTTGFLAIASSLYFHILFGFQYSNENITKIIRDIPIIVLLSQLIIAAHSLARKAKEFNALLYQVMITDETKLAVLDNKLRIHISMKWGIAITACDFFTLDNTLIHSITAAVTTYLVMLIQFSKQKSLNVQSGSNTTTLL